MWYLFLYFSFYFTDFSSNRLYWIDNFYNHIRSSHLNGSDIILLATSPEYMPLAQGLIVFKDWIYCTSSTNNSIYRVNKKNGTNFEVVKSDLRTPLGIKIYSKENQPTGILLVRWWWWWWGGYMIHANDWVLHKDKIQSQSRWRFVKWGFGF